MASSEKEKDTWISKVSQAILDYNSVYIPPPPPQANNNSNSGIYHTSGGHKQRNLSGGSFGSRTNSSSNIASEAGEGGALSPQDEDGEEGLLTFDDVPQS